MDTFETVKSLAIIGNMLGIYYVYNKQNEMFKLQKKLSFELLYKPRQLTEVDEFRDWIVEIFKITQKLYTHFHVELMVLEDFKEEMTDIHYAEKVLEFGETANKYTQTLNEKMNNYMYQRVLFNLWEGNPTSNKGLLDQFHWYASVVSKNNHFSTENMDFARDKKTLAEFILTFEKLYDFTNSYIKDSLHIEKNCDTENPK